jgi:hypothetical protein
MADKKNKGKKLNRMSAGEAEALAISLYNDGHKLSTRYIQLLKTHPSLKAKMQLVEEGKAKA